MQSALAFDYTPEPLPRSCLMELTVGVQLAAPWAWVQNGVLGGIEVEDARAFAKWLGRPIRFEILEPEQIAQALEESEIDIAIGGIRGDRQLSGVALSCRYSARTFGHGEERHGSRLSHVWAMPRRAASLFATLAFYLWMVRPGVPEPELEAVRLH
jgi:ABC-type amino acid transport substrate-binding protein